MWLTIAKSAHVMYMYDEIIFIPIYAPNIRGTVIT